MRFFATTLMAATMAFAAPAIAVTWDLTGSGSSTLLGTSQSFLSGGYSVNVTALNTQQPPVPFLTQSSGGLGVNTGRFDSNTLDNFGNDEAAVFDFGRLAALSGISLTSLSGNDDFRVYGTNNGSVLNCASGGLGCISSISTLLLASSGNSGAYALAGLYQYVIVAGVTGGFNDDFRISSISAAPVPLPAALPLFSGGLGLMAMFRWRKNRRKRAV